MRSLTVTPCSRSSKYVAYWSDHPLPVSVSAGQSAKVYTSKVCNSHIVSTTFFSQHVYSPYLLNIFTANSPQSKMIMVETVLLYKSCQRFEIEIGCFATSCKNESYPARRLPREHSQTILTPTRTALLCCILTGPGRPKRKTREEDLDKQWCQSSRLATSMSVQVVHFCKFIKFLVFGNPTIL